jgi:phosphatidylserine decarboxylase
VNKKVIHRLASCDWRAWLAVAWAFWFGWLYGVMVLETKFPHALAWLRRVMAVCTGER